VKNNILKTAEKMPEEHWGSSPAPDQRPYIQVVAHVAVAHDMEQYTIMATRSRGLIPPSRAAQVKAAKDEAGTALWWVRIVVSHGHKP
jgi:hypothetical protein